MDWVNALRNSVTFTLPDWVLYSLPDGLWIYSYILVIGAIRNFNIRESTLAIFCLPTVAIISEFLQLPGIIPGTFDSSDILAYTLGMALGIIHIIKTNQYEKNHVSKFNKTTWTIIAIVLFIIAGAATGEDDKENAAVTEESATQTEQTSLDDTPEPEWNTNSTDEETVEIDNDEIIFSNSSDDETVVDEMVDVSIVTED